MYRTECHHSDRRAIASDVRWVEGADTADPAGRAVGKTVDRGAGPPGRGIAVPVPAPIPLLRAVALQSHPEILARVGFDPAQLPGGGAMAGTAGFLPLRPVLRLLSRAAAATRDPGIAVRLADAGRLACLGDLGRHIRGSDSLDEAIGRACATFDWWMPGARLAIARDGPNLVWQAALPFALGPEAGIAKPWLLALLRAILRVAAGPTWQPLALLCEQGGRLERAFGRPVIEDRTVTALVFPGSLRALAMPPGAPTGDTLAAALHATRAPTDLAGSLRALIRSLLPEACVDAVAVAQLAGLSLRALQRALAADGISFSELLREARLERAIELMREPTQRMTDIGLELGYSDAANFTRAFRRWTGSTPRAYRQRLLAESS